MKVIVILCLLLAAAVFFVLALLPFFSGQEGFTFPEILGAVVGGLIGYVAS
ncbi:MAG: hypothetical protein AAB567_01735 [Patescibacteria group bacterium]